MADYQSLLIRAVANLPNASTAAARHAIYDRARVALVTQLRSLRPPLPDSDIEREERALDKAIAQVESQFGPGEAPHEAPAEARSAPSQPSAPSRPPAPKPTESRAPAPPPPPVAPATPRHAPVAPPAPPRAAPSAPEGPPPQAPATKPFQPAPAPAVTSTQPRPAPSRPPAPTAPPQHTPAPLLPAASAGPAAGKPAAPLAASGATAAPRAAPGAAKPPPVQVAPTPDDRVNANAAPPVTLVKSDSGAAAPANLAKVVPSALAEHAEGRGVPPVIAILGDDAEPASPSPVAPADVERVGSAPRLESEGQRPSAPTTIAETRRSWPWLALAVVVGVVLSIAGAAILMRQKPQDLAIAPPPEPQQEATQTPAKIAQRAEPSPAVNRAPAPEPASPAPASGEPQAGQTAQSGQAAAPPEAQNPDQLPAAGRAAMLIASPDNPQKPVVNLGSTVWSTIPATPGQPATIAVKADADIPDLKMHATMILRKNTDPTLEATHTIDLKFSFAEGASITGFKDVGLPQMRKLDATASEQLNSVKVKISDDYFLIALAKGDQDLARNLDLMKTRAWFDFPLLLNDDRIAKLVFQKSTDGEGMLEKAFDAWK